MNENELNYLMNALFFFNSKVDIEKKKKICEWYSNLPIEQRKMVEILRSEAAIEAEYFAQGD